MSLAWYLVLEREIEGFDHGVNGKAIAHAGELLDTAAKEAGVQPLLHFFSAAPDELASLIESEGIDLGFALPREEWYPADDGLTTVRALVHAAENGKIAVPDMVINDLKRFEDVLRAARDKGVAWRLW